MSSALPAIWTLALAVLLTAPSSERVPGVWLVQSPPEPPAVSQPVSLHCLAPGPVVSRLWLKDGQPLSPDSRVTFSQDNSTLAFSAALLSDSGSYQCVVSSASGTETSPGLQLSVQPVSSSSPRPAVPLFPIMAGVLTLLIVGAFLGSYFGFKRYRVRQSQPFVSRRDEYEKRFVMEE
ncbi:HMCN2 protein, partial [Atractosteus spatula]|nr:HMCN2 protein [Atractosteus spatula]